MSNTTNLNIALVASNQSQKEVTVNTAITTIDAVLNRGAIDMALDTPPGSPSDGDLYVIGASPTGDWASNAGDIAFYQSGWYFIAPNEGMRIWVNDEDVIYTYDGSGWVSDFDVDAPASSSGALTIDMANGNFFEVTLTENVSTTVFSNPPASGKAGKFTLILKQDGTGGRTFAWPASVDWAGGSAPTLTTAASAVDILDFISTDGGTTWYGNVIGLDVK